MFGDVGGLNDFLGLFFATVFGYFSENLKVASMIERIFHQSMMPSKTDRRRYLAPHQAFESIKELKLPTSFVILNSLYLNICQKGKARRQSKILKAGSKRLHK